MAERINVKLKYSIITFIELFNTYNMTRILIDSYVSLVKC